MKSPFLNKIFLETRKAFIAVIGISNGILLQE